MKKKIVSLLMLGVLFTMAVAGCANSANANGKSSENQSTAQSSSTDKNASGQKTEIDFWYSGGKTAVGVVQNIIDEYNASQNKYTVKAVTQADYDETYQKLQAAIAGNVAPDLVLLGASSARSLYDKKLLTDLTSMTSKDSSFHKDDYLKVFYNQGVDEKGKVYALPAYGTTQIMYYNIAAFKDAGVNASDIKTWQDLAAAAKKIKDTGKYKFGWEPMWGPDNLIDAALSNGGKILNDDKTKVTINTKEWVDVWDSIGKWIHEDQTMSIHSGGQGWEYWYATIDDVMKNTAGGYTGSSGDQGDLDFKVVAAMEQPAWTTGTKSAPIADALTLSIPSKSSKVKQQGAYDFMKYFTNAKNQTTWTMKTGYVPVNNKVNDNADYKKYVQANPQAAVPLSQAAHASVYPVDPTNGVIHDALKKAADEVEIDGTSAQKALDEAQATAQAALNEKLGK